MSAQIEEPVDLGRKHSKGPHGHPRPYDSVSLLPESSSSTVSPASSAEASCQRWIQDFDADCFRELVHASTLEHEALRKAPTYKYGTNSATNSVLPGLLGRVVLLKSPSRLRFHPLWWIPEALAGETSSVVLTQTLCLATRTDKGRQRVQPLNISSRHLQGNTTAATAVKVPAIQ